MRHAVIGTAGHVDHGKTTLTRALTGVDTDRLREEKERGLSIDIGFAPLVLPDGRTASIVDVPGHERFIRNMVAGASGIDMVLLVIAADEGVMPQTAEHLDIIDLLGVREGIVVLTKIDLVEDEWATMVETDVREALADTSLSDAPIVRVSAGTGEGLDRLRELIAGKLDAAAPRDEASPFRMPIDRVFTMRGFGTVVTGTLARGRVGAGESAEVHPGSRRSRIRQVQVHGAEVEEACAGQRVALNLPELTCEQLARGDVVAAPGSLRDSAMLDVRVRLIARGQGSLRNWQRMRVHIGTAEIMARVVLLEVDHLEPGGDGLVQLRLEAPTAAAAGERFVLRSYSPATTLGGGIVLDPAPVKHHGARRREAARRLEQAETGGPGAALSVAVQNRHGRPFTEEQIIQAAGLDSRTGEAAVAEALAGGRLIALPVGLLIGAQDVAQARQVAEDALSRFHGERPLRRGMETRELRSAAAGIAEPVFREAIVSATADGRIAEEPAGQLRLTTWTDEVPEQWQRACDAVMAAAAAAELYGLSIDNIREAAPDAGTMLADLVRRLTEDGKLVPVGGRYVAADEVAGARGIIAEHLKAHGTLTVAEFRDAVGTARRPSVAMLEYFDSIGFTVREGDVRRLRNP